MEVKCYSYFSFYRNVAILKSESQIKMFDIKNIAMAGLMPKIEGTWKS